MIIDGKKLAAKIRSEIKKAIAAKKCSPGLAFVLVGEDEASRSYVKSKIKACQEVGIKNFDHVLSADAKEEELLKLIKKLNADKNVHGILVQMPLPRHINSMAIFRAIAPEKDVDGFHPMNLGKLLEGERGPRPCTPLGIMELIDSTGCDLKGMGAVVVGRSNIVGKPVAMMLLERHATVTICHSRTASLPDVVKGADVLVVAIGRPNFIKGSWIKKGAVVIDVGINRMEDGQITGDVDFDSAKDIAGYITPVPGGVGPMTIAMLLKNTLEACI